VQDIIYRKNRLRIDTSKFYIRNAVENRNDWKESSIITDEVEKFAKIMAEYKNTCKIIFTFGENAYRFAKSCENPTDSYEFRNISDDIKIKNESKTLKLGSEFINRIDNFNINKSNIIPLLHVSISRGNFLISHEQFCKGLKIKGEYFNYFDETSKLIADLFINHFINPNIWI